MKTFLWCDQDFFQYEFIAANADSIEQARNIATESINEQHQADRKRIDTRYEGFKLSNPEWSSTYDNQKKDSYLYSEAARDALIEMINAHEPSVLDAYSGGIFAHANE